MTNGWIDIKNTDMMLIAQWRVIRPRTIPADSEWAMEAKRNRNAKLISVDPLIHARHLPLPGRSFLTNSAPARTCCRSPGGVIRHTHLKITASPTIIW